MDASIGIAALAGLFVPFIVSFLKNVNWNTKVKHIIAVVVSGAIGVGITAIDNKTNLTDWSALLTNIAVVFGVSQVWYNQYFGGTALNAKIENIGVGAGNGGDFNV